jgi:nitrous oxide reductase
MIKQILLTSMVAVICVHSAHAATYECYVDKKYAADLSVIQSKDEVEKYKFKITIREGAKVTLDRCSFAPSQNAITCDSYEADRVEFTNTQFVKIKKFYVTRSQYDVQIFENLTFVENNGRGSIASGKCIVGL